MFNLQGEDQQKGEMSASLQNQIFSMLNGVIDEDDQTNEYSQDFIDKIFSTEGDDETTIGELERTHLFFERQNSSKPKTAKVENISLSQNINCGYDGEFVRKNHKRFQTAQTQYVPIPLNQIPFLRSTPYQHLRYTHIHPNPYQNLQAYCHPPKKKFNTMIITNPLQLYQCEPFLSSIEVKLFQNKKIDFPLFQELSGKISTIIQLQKGARILLTYIENTSKDILNFIYEEIKPKLSILLLDQYANRFCMKLYFELPNNSKMDYLQSISHILAGLAVNKVSTYPIQCIVENLTTIPEKELIVSSLNTCYMALALDVYGTHVLEKMILCFEYNLIKDLGAFVANNFFLLATNANGLCIVKKILIKEYKLDHHMKLRSELIKNCTELIQDPYGNYAIQIALDNWEPTHIEGIINSLNGKAVMLSNQKYSSNVIEKCFEKSTAYMSSYINEICEDMKTFLKILKNNYGNYVLQTALKIAKETDLSILLNSIESALEFVSEKKRINKWKRILSSYKDQSFLVHPNFLPNEIGDFFNDTPAK